MSGVAFILLVVARALQFGSGMLLVNATLFRSLVLLPACRGRPDLEALGWARLLPRLPRLTRAGLAVLVVAGLLHFWITAAEMSGSILGGALDLPTLGTVLFQTQFGHVCQVRLGLVVLFAGLTALARNCVAVPRERDRGLEIAQELVAVALWVSLAWTGHAAAHTGWPLMVSLAADGLHLAATGIWPAGLLLFAWTLGLEKGPDAAGLALIVAVTRRFSAVSLGAVLMLAATGTVNAWFDVGSFSALVGTPYGRVLLLKLAFFGVILLFAAWNRYRLLPALFATEERGDTAAGGGLVRRLRRSVWAELALAGAVVLIVSVLGITPPAR